MSRIFITGTDPLDIKRKMYARKDFEIEKGLTVIVGCNGSGKQEQLKKENIPCLKFDNLTMGGSNSYDELLHSNNINALANMFCSSEGEGIMNSVGRVAEKIKGFMATGHIRGKFEIFLSDEQKEKIKKKAEHKERWILFDATDSGLSIDNVRELKSLFDLIIKDFPELDLYILITANEYEMAKDQDCLDVQSNKYIRFNDYDDYSNFIIKSRKKKDKQIERMIEKSKKEDKD